MSENEEKKDIEVISGDGTDLDISPVYDNVNTLNPKKKNEKPQNIVIPKSTNKAN